MAGRYKRDFDIDFAGSQAFADPEQAVQHKPDALEQIQRLVAGVAPAAGTAIGLATGGPAGAMIGNSLGQGIGSLAGYGADQAAEPDRQAEEQRVAREEERKARAQAAMGIVGGM